MKFTEFKEEMEKFNLGVVVNGSLHPNALCVYDLSSQQTVAVVDDVDVAIVKTSYMQFQSYEVSKRLALFDVFVKYANTPLGERHTEDEFVFEYTGSKTRKQYFTYDIHTQMVGFRVDPWNWITRWRFTASNIANMTKEAQGIICTLTKRPYSNKIQREAEGEIHA